MVEIDGPTTGNDLELLTFRATGVDRRAISIEWDSGDGTTATGETFTHNYTQPGRYLLSVQTFSPRGILDRDELTVEIVERGQEQPPDEEEPPADSPFGPTPEPQQREGGLAFTLPFSAFNFAPWISNVEDVEVVVPQLPSIREVVTDIQPDLPQIGQRSAQDTMSFPVLSDAQRVLESHAKTLLTNFAEVKDIPRPVDNALRTAQEITTVDVPDLGVVVDDVTDAVDDIPTPAVPNLEAVVEDVTAEVDSLRTDVVPDLEAVVTATLDDLQEAGTETLNDVQTAVNGEVRTVQDSIGQAAAAVFGAGATLFDALADVKADTEKTLDGLDETLADTAEILNILPDDFRAGVADGVEDAQSTVEGFGFIADPVRWLEEALDQASDDLDEQAIEGLQAAERAATRRTAGEGS